MLGGTILCITGSEALFADLGHFNRNSIQIAFLFTIYPSLILTYAGQTAYLIRNPNDHIDGFYKFIPKTIYWPIFIIATSAAVVASQVTNIRHLLCHQTICRTGLLSSGQGGAHVFNKEGEVYSPEVNYILMILCVAVILVFGDGQDIGNAFGVVVSLVMLITTILLTLVMIIIWRTPPLLVAMYFIVFFTMEGVYRKIQYELTHKIDLGRLGLLLSDTSVQRVPGLCFFYSNIQNGLTPILGHYIKNTRSLHSVTIFTTLRYLLVPKVAPQERIIVKKLGLKGVYACVIQYGYADSLNLEGDDFVSQVMDSLRVHIEASYGCLPSDLTQGQEEISELREAKIAGVIHVRGKARFYIGKNTSLFDRLMLAFYEVLHNNCRSALPALGVPLPQRLEVGMFYEA
ncbi:hypothetical protein V6N13_026098 [Hibiscus sabdariffa]|uniref:Potassium transporter n=1 Tax=Hibiscus sabdariffa TaxID=183260 RepID=A0ABR2AQ11_9ROSI